MENSRKVAVISLAVLAVADALLWRAVVFGGGPRQPKLYFLDVGQGDSSLIVLPAPEGGRPLTMLIDGGPDATVLDRLSAVVSERERYLDLVVMTHPQLDHFGGLVDVLKRYAVGAFIWSGRPAQTVSYGELVQTLRDREVRSVTLGAGDSLTYGEYHFTILSPSAKSLTGADVNDASIVILLEAPDFRALYTGDIGPAAEGELAPMAIASNILKVPHHGSKFSSSAGFLNAVGPQVAVIEVGRNRYGHPSEEALTRLRKVGARVFRTDRDGTVGITSDHGAIKVFTSPNN